MTNYYVSPSGNNTRSGTNTANALKTPQTAIDKMSGGDILYFMNGTWNNENISDIPNGNSNEYTKLLAYQNSKPKFDNKSCRGFFIDMDNTGSAYIHIKGIEATNFNHGIFCRGARNILIDNVDIHYMKTTTVSFGDSHHCTVQNSNLADTGWNMLQVSAANENTYNIDILNNTIHGSPGKTNFGTSHAGIDLFNCYQGTKQCNSKISYINIVNNKIYNISDAGIFTHGGHSGTPDPNTWTTYIDKAYIACNELYNTNGFHINYFKNSLIKNNYLHDSNHWGFYGADEPRMMDGVVFDGNVSIGAKSQDASFITRFKNNTEYRNGFTKKIESWGGSTTLIIYDNNAKDYTVIAKYNGSAYIRYSDNRNFTVDGKSCQHKSNYSEYFIQGVSGVGITHQIVNPNGSNSHTIPSCVGSPSTPTPTPITWPTPTPTPWPTPTPTPTPTTGSVYCTCNQVANITLNDKDPQTTPHTYHNVPTGMQLVRFSKPNYRTNSRYVIVKGGETQTIYVELKYHPLPSFQISFKSTPPNATIFRV